jgi:putative transposase
MMTTKLRTGSFFPALLVRRRRVDQCLFAVVMEAYLHGTSTRKVDDMVKALVADLGGRDVGLRSLAEQIDTPVPQDVWCFMCSAHWLSLSAGHRVR